MAPVNEVATSTGRRQAVCEFCGRRSRPVARLHIWAVGGGWSCAPYSDHFEHFDGSRGTLWTCPRCSARLDRGEGLTPDPHRGGAADSSTVFDRSHTLP